MTTTYFIDGCGCCSCCGITPHNVYIWGSFLSTGNPVPPTFGGTVALNLFGFGDGFWNSFSWDANQLFTIPWNESPGTVRYSTLDDYNYPYSPSPFLNYRFTTSCDNITPAFVAAIEYYSSGTPTIPSGYTGDMAFTIPSVQPDYCNPPDGCFTGLIPSSGVGSYVRYYFTDRDPSTGILCPDGSIIDTQISVTMTLGGVPDPSSYPPQPVTLTFSPYLELDAIVNLFLTPHLYCYSWFGHYTNCTGHETRLVLYYDGANWNFMVGDPSGPGTARVVYSGTSLPTTGATGDASPCVDGYTLNYSSMGMMAAKPSKTTPSPARKLPKRKPCGCGKKKGK
jgi:hypothetical protein